MQILEPPANLQPIVTFRLPQGQTWGSKMDRVDKEQIRAASGLPSLSKEHYQWFAFVIRCKIASHRGKVRKQIPDVENIPKLIVDAFTNILHEDDNVILCARGTGRGGTIGG